MDLGTKLTSVNIYYDTSLEQLNLVPGVLVGFDNTDSEGSLPFLLAIADRIEEGFNDRDGIKLVFDPENGDRREWTLFTQGKALALWSPRQYGGLDQKMFPHYTIIHQGKSYINPYFVEYAFSGEQAVLGALESRKGHNLDYYAESIKSGRLITERGRVGNFLKGTVLAHVLPNQLRFR